MSDREYAEDLDRGPDEVTDSLYGGDGSGDLSSDLREELAEHADDGTCKGLLAAARRFLALTETGPRLVDAVDAICEVEFGEDVEEEMWDELLDAGIEVRAALADYLTEEE